MKIELINGVYYDCTNVILVPEKAITEPGYIQTFSEGITTSSKHQFHAMSQMAYFQYQDGEFDIKHSMGEIRLVTKDQTESMTAGLILLMTGERGLHGLSCGGSSVKKLLETAYRYCTRWVRLDI